MYCARSARERSVGTAPKPLCRHEGVGAEITQGVVVVLGWGDTPSCPNLYVDPAFPEMRARIVPAFPRTSSCALCTYAWDAEYRTEYEIEPTHWRMDAERNTAEKVVDNA